MRFRIWSIALFVLVLFSTTGALIGQNSVISERDFLDANRAAYWATEKKYPRRETRKYEVLSDGKATYSETEVTESLDIRKYRITTTVVSKGKTSTKEEIQIGEVRYCRENTSEWESYCAEPPPAPAMGHVDGAGYGLELNGDTKTYQRSFQTTREEKDKLTRTSFTTTDRTIFNRDSSYRERSIIKTNTESKELVSRSAFKFEYGIKFDPIVAPVK